MKKTFIFGFIMIATLCFMACSNDDDLNEMMVGGTTGTATDSRGRSIKWVQLWAGGPKFAVSNLGDEMPYYEAVGEEEVIEEEEEEEDELSRFKWGNNWCAPSKDDMEELVRAANGDKNAKVSCKYECLVGEWGFTFTGKETGYTGNSVFLCSMMGNNNRMGITNYWVSTPTGDKGKAWCMVLQNMDGSYSGYWSMKNKDEMYLLRPVLNE